MKNSILQAINKQEDDITFIFIHNLDLNDHFIEQRIFESNLETIDIANDWYSDRFSELCNDSKIIYSASIVFTELFMNAYEHGNLGLDSKQKHQLLQDDVYFETLGNLEKECDKKIFVNLYKLNYDSSSYIITQIKDEGLGFDTKILSEIFRNSKSLNGRGVFVSRESSSGIYYNSMGNSVLFLHKIEG